MFASSGLRTTTCPGGTAILVRRSSWNFFLSLSCPRATARRASCRDHTGVENRGTTVHNRTTMRNEDSSDVLLAGLDQGHGDLQSEVFQRFAKRLVKLARSRLDDRIRRTTDPEDVMQSVWLSFFVRQSATAGSICGTGATCGPYWLVKTIRKCTL